MITLPVYTLPPFETKYDYNEEVHCSDERCAHNSHRTSTVTYYLRDVKVLKTVASHPNGKYYDYDKSDASLDHSHQDGLVALYMLVEAPNGQRAVLRRWLENSNRADLHHDDDWVTEADFDFNKDYEVWHYNCQCGCGLTTEYCEYYKENPWDAPEGHFERVQQARLANPKIRVAGRPVAGYGYGRN